MTRKTVLMLLVAIFVAAHTAIAEPTTLSLTEAINLAMRNNHKIQIAQTQVYQADAEARSTAARFFPILKADGHALWWNDAYEIDVMDFVEVDPAIQVLVDYIIGDLPPIELRSDMTTEFNLTAIQPITPLFKVYQGYQAGRAAKTARQAMARRTRREITLKTIQAYYQLLSVLEMRDVAQAAVDTISAHVDQAQEFAKQEFIGRHELLTAEVELASAQEMLIRAKSGVSLASSALAHVMGLPLDVELTLTDRHIEVPGGLPDSLDDAQRLADLKRDELIALRAKAKATERLEKLAYWGLTPDLAAVGRYSYHDGNLLHEEEEMFAGLTMEWNFWEWGRQWHTAKAAGWRHRRANLEAIEAAQLVRLQVKQQFLRLDSARQRLAVMDKAVARATEALRICQLRFEENLDTSIDVMDAQTRLTKAKADRIKAEYDVLTGKSELLLATGADPWTVESSADRAGDQ
ncbi:MAG: TolC family protein [Candidatus Lernaella stagnicola]|nr:TolC family protein [Candidatus Lernaella stagnicola]